VRETIEPGIEPAERREIARRRAAKCKRFSAGLSVREFEREIPTVNRDRQLRTIIKTAVTPGINATGHKDCHQHGGRRDDWPVTSSHGGLRRLQWRETVFELPFDVSTTTMASSTTSPIASTSEQAQHVQREAIPA